MCDRAWRASFVRGVLGEFGRFGSASAAGDHDRMACDAAHGWISVRVVVGIRRWSWASLDAVRVSRAHDLGKRVVSRSMNRNRNETVGPLVLIEEAVHVMRTAPITVLSLYYAGTLPLVLAVLFFWTDMSHGAFAESRLIPGSLLVAVAFIWMKAWHAMFARGVHDFVTGAPASEVSIQRFMRQVAIQGYHHALGIIALPLSFIAVLPFPWVFAYYQNLTVLGDLDAVEPGDLTSESRHQASAWPLQNVAIMWLLSPFLLMVGLILYSAIMPIVNSAGGDLAQVMVYLYTAIFALAVLPLSPLGAVIAINLNIAVSAVPTLANMWFGIETPFTQAVVQNNTTTWAIVCGLAYLVMDPTMKTAYTLRCFYSQSRKSGVDLEVGLRRVRNRTGTGVVLIVMAASAVFGGVAVAQEPTLEGVNTIQLDSAIQETLQQREYSWRMPRDYDFDNPVGGFIGDMLREVVSRIVNAIRAVLDWLRPLWEAIRGLFNGRGDGNRIAGGITAAGLRTFLLGAAGLFAIALAAYLLRRWYTGREVIAEAEAVAVAPPPDLEDENITADALPEDQWMAMAEDLLAKGERRLAIRALFLASLARLGEHGLINLARYKSNYDYASELRRRAHAAPDHVSSFDTMVSAFERVWYGAHAITDELITSFRKLKETVGTRV
jgi:hypothetical protein